MLGRMAGKETWKLASDKVSPILTGGLNAFLSKYWARAPTAGLAMDFLENQQVSFLPPPSTAGGFPIPN